MTCRQCQTEIAEKALICYRCGAATSEPRVKAPSAGSLFDRPPRSWPSAVALAVVIAIVVVAVWFFAT